MMRRSFVILDRDGTVIHERNHLADPDQVALLPGAGEALAAISELGYGLLLVTNQSVVGRGIVNTSGLDRIHARLKELLAEYGVILDGIYFCPHTPEAGCTCRKPGIGLVQAASRELGFDPAESIVVGDKESDIEMGARIGAATFLVRTGYGAFLERSGFMRADYVVDDLGEVALVLKARRASKPPGPRNSFSDLSTTHD